MRIMELLEDILDISVFREGLLSEEFIRRVEMFGKGLEDVADEEDGLERNETVHIDQNRLQLVHVLQV